MAVCAEDTILKIESKILEQIGPKKFNVWFKNATRFQLTGGEYLRVSTPNNFVGEWIERNFSDIIAQAAHDVTGNGCEVTFAIDPDLVRAMAKKQTDRQADYLAQNAERLARQPRPQPAPLIHPPLRGRFEDFVVGDSNRHAYRSAQSIIEAPGEAYNSLFIHGGCGVGKTHLLQAVCNGLSERHPNLCWRYVTGEEFTNDFVYAVKAQERDAFRDRYRNIDCLVIDDVHFFASKRATQEEFLNTFKAVDAVGKQIVLASDTHPRMIGHFSDSLISRFLSGMVIRIDAPDLDTRVGVLKRRVQKLKVDISEPVIMHIAESIHSNIRELEGALLNVVAHAQVSGEPITLSLAERAIRDLVRQTAPVVLLSDIESMVAIYFGLSPADLHTSRKSRTIALARGITMFLARKHTKMSFPEIGRFMGNKNHSTVILACRRIKKMLDDSVPARWLTPAGERECNLASLIEELEEHLSAGRALHRA